MQKKNSHTGGTRHDRSITPDVGGAGPGDLLEMARSLNVRFLRLQFTDILGVNKHVEVPASQFEKALAGDMMFDGSSIEGFVRVEESDMLLAPDLATFRVLPWGEPDARGHGSRILHVQAWSQRRAHHADARRGRLLRPRSSGSRRGRAARHRGRP